MSLANIIIQPDCAYLVTDSGYFRPDGTIVALHPKTMTFPELSLAIATTGSITCGHLAREILKAPPSTQDAFLKRIPAIVRAAYEESGMDPVERFSYAVIATYSRRLGRAVGYVLWTSPNEGAPGREPWRLHAVRGVRMPFIPPKAVPDAPDYTDPAYSPYRNEMAFVEVQRRPRSSWGGVQAGCAVAGDIELTAVSRTGIETTTLHTYPDEVGRTAAA